MNISININVIYKGILNVIMLIQIIVLNSLGYVKVLCIPLIFEVLIVLTIWRKYYVEQFN